MKVQMVRWPVESERRDRLDAEVAPRLLVIEGRAPAPDIRHELEDWVRPPISRRDLESRLDTLAARALANAVPTVDEDNVLRYGPQRLGLSPAGGELMRTLCENFGRVVDRDDLITVIWTSSAGPDRRNALDLRVMRLRRRVESMRLVIRTAWGRGYMLSRMVTERFVERDPASEIVERDQASRLCSPDGIKTRHCG